MDSPALALELAAAAHGKLGEEIQILDLRSLPVVADFFVLVTAGSPLHAQAVGRALEEELERVGVRPHHVEGAEAGRWVVLDYFDVVVHIFLGDVRRFYGLERLWGDVPVQGYPQATDGAQRTG